MQIFYNMKFNLCSYGQLFYLFQFLNELMKFLGIERRPGQESTNQPNTVTISTKGNYYSIYRKFRIKLVKR